MEIIDLQQGTPEWHAHRARHWNASDAPAMMGCSPYKSRTQLLHEMSSGIIPDVGPELQARFDAGHRFEALARPIAERIIGDELYPCVGTSGRYSASFDGLTMDESTAFEHKTLNADILEAFAEMSANPVIDPGFMLPLLYRVQMEHQMHVSGAERTLFMASRFDMEGTLIEERHTWYYPDPELRAAVLQGWEQFEKDLADFVPVHHQPKLQGARPDMLPALRVEVTGQVQATNLPEFKAHAVAVIEGINTTLTTDQDFADAEASVKWCAEVESRLAASKQHALAQTSSIEELFRTIDDINELVRRKRLALEKLVKSRKDEIKIEMVTKAQAALRDHITELNASLVMPILPMPVVAFAECLKGKRNLDSMQDAIDTLLATVKAEANSTSLQIATNMLAYAAAGADKLPSLFPDLKQIALKPHEDFKAIVAQRLQQHAGEQERLKQRAEEEARIQRERTLKEYEEQQAKKDQPAPAAVEVHIAGNGVKFIRPAAEEPAANSAPTLGLGEIKARIAPLSIDAAGLESLGFPAVKVRAACMYQEKDWPAMLEAMIWKLCQCRPASALGAA